MFSFLKKLILLLFLLVVPAQALATKAVWDPVVCPDGVLGYKLYLGQTPGNYDMVIDCGLATEWPLINALYPYIAVSAYNEWGESALSEEVSWFDTITSLCDLDGSGAVGPGDDYIFMRHWGKCTP